MATLFLTKEQIFLTRKTKEERLLAALVPHERLLLDLKSLACWERPLPSAVILAIVVSFLVQVPEYGGFFFLSTALLLGKTLNLARTYGLWGARPAPSSAPSSPDAPQPPATPPPPIDVDLPRLAQRIVPIWLHAEHAYERLLRLRWESRGRFCAVASFFCLIGYVIGDTILPLPVLTICVFLALTLPALAHHQFHRRLLRRFAPLLIQFDLAVDIKRRPFGGRAAGDRRAMRGSRHFDTDSRLQDIDEVSDDVHLPEDLDDAGQATDDGEDADFFDEDADASLAFNAASLRDENRHHLVRSHLELPPEDAPLLSVSERGTAPTSRAAGNRHSAPPSLFTTNRDLQDLGLLPFDERMDEDDDGFGRDKDGDVDSADEATGLTPDWSREGSGDEDDDASLMEFLPEGVSRMPSITPRSSRPAIEEDYRGPRQRPRATREYEQHSDRLNARLLAAGADVLASSGVRLQHSLTALADNVTRRNQQQHPYSSSQLLRSQIADALMDDANGNTALRDHTPASSTSSDENSGFEILEPPNPADESAILEAAMREEGL